MPISSIERLSVPEEHRAEETGGAYATAIKPTPAINRQPVFDVARYAETIPNRYRTCPKPSTTIMLWNTPTTRPGKRSRLRAGVHSAIVAVCIACATSDAQAPGDTSRPVCMVTGVTEPSNRATLSSMVTARIERFPIEEGGAVRAGDAVVVLDDDVQRTRTTIARARADSDVGVRLAFTRWQQSQQLTGEAQPRDISVIHAGFHQRAAPNRSTEATESADGAIARLRYELELYEHSQVVLQWKHERQLLSEYRILAPFDGHVYDHLKHSGETAAPDEPLITLICVDPLRLRLDCPVALAPFVMTGNRFMVMPLDRHWSARTGTVVRIRRLIDVRTQTFGIELNIENDDELWRAGLEVSVDLYDPLQDRLDRHTNAAPVRPWAVKPNADVQLFHVAQ